MSVCKLVMTFRENLLVVMYTDVDDVYFVSTMRDKTHLLIHRYYGAKLSASEPADEMLNEKVSLRNADVYKLGKPANANLFAGDDLVFAHYYVVVDEAYEDYNTRVKYVCDIIQNNYFDPYTSMTKQSPDDVRSKATVHSLTATEFARVVRSKDQRSTAEKIIQTRRNDTDITMPDSDMIPPFSVLTIKHTKREIAKYLSQQNGNITLRIPGEHTHIVPGLSSVFTKNGDLYKATISTVEVQWAVDTATETLVTLADISSYKTMLRISNVPVTTLLRSATIPPFKATTASIGKTFDWRYYATYLGYTLIEWIAGTQFITENFYNDKIDTLKKMSSRDLAEQVTFDDVCTLDIQEWQDSVRAESFAPVTSDDFEYVVPRKVFSRNEQVHTDTTGPLIQKYRSLIESKELYRSENADNVSPFILTSERSAVSNATNLILFIEAMKKNVAPFSSDWWERDEPIKTILFTGGE